MHSDSSATQMPPHAAELLLCVPRGFEPEAALEMGALTGVSPAAIYMYPTYGLLRLPLLGSLDTVLDAASRSPILVGVYAYLGSFEADPAQLTDTTLPTKAARAASIIAGIRDDGHRLAWPAATAMWSHLRQRAGKAHDPVAVAFRASFEKFATQIKDLPTQDLAGAVGEGCITRWRAQHAGAAPRVDLLGFDLEVAAFLLRREAAAPDDANADGDGGEAAPTSPAPPPRLARSQASLLADAPPPLVLAGVALPLALIAPPGSPGSQLGAARNRVAAGRTALRPATAYALARFADIRPGEVVLDPCCGVATIPIEAALGFPHAVYLAGDHDGDQLCDGGLANVRHALLRPAGGAGGEASATGGAAAAGAGGGRSSCGPHKVDLVVWDAARLPLRRGIVDVLVSDLPWGVRENRTIAGKGQRDRLYAGLLRQVDTLLAPGPRSRAVFVTGATRQFKEAIERAGGYIRLAHQRDIVIGDRPVCMYLLHRA